MIWFEKIICISSRPDEHSHIIIKYYLLLKFLIIKKLILIYKLQCKMLFTSFSRNIKSFKNKLRFYFKNNIKNNKKLIISNVHDMSKIKKGKKLILIMIFLYSRKSQFKL